MGMCAVQSSLPMIDTLPFEEYGARKRIMMSLLLLLILRAHLVGINQVQMVYMSHLDVDADFELVQVI